MAFEFNLPSLGEKIESADVINVLVKVGDQVKADQAVIELETDKATIEVPSPVAGVVQIIHVKVGDKVKIGQAVMYFETAAPGAAAAVAPTPTAVSAVPPAMAIAATQVTISTPVPAAVPPPAPLPAPPAITPPRASESGVATPVPAAPSVRRFAREIGIEIGEVRGTGSAGRISLDDVKTYAKSLHQRLSAEAQRPAASGPALSAEALPDFSKWGAVEVEPMSNVRRVTAQHLSRAWQTIPHVTQFDEADITDLEALREKFGARVEKAGAKLTPTAIIVKVVAEALRRFPQFNASVDMANLAVVRKQYVNVGVAVDTDRGLLVPVLRDVDKKSIVQIAIELNALATKARARKTGIEDMQGGNFTVSNLGGIGGVGFTPIVNWPEVAILGVARGSVKPVWNGKEFVPRTILPLALSYDHRLIDGADGARFLRWIAAAIEEPFLLHLGL